MNRKRFLLLFSLFFFTLSFVQVQADVHKKVVLQAFWWDYWNDNYPNAYANYLTELAPRLKKYGINAVWVPAFYKNKDATGSMGYSPFDHYDLGDKYQKGSVTTRFGTKDDVLRMIAVMHANGIEVLEDIVLNHVDGAGSERKGADGGEDPQARDNKWKNFRYVSYATPVGDGSAQDYWSRSGRWPKNWPNFHPNDGHNSNTGEWCSDWWGPDICYEPGAYGQSSNAKGFNPVQGENYMRNEARNWMMWFKKQTAVDGYRWDAVKHFPEYAQQDFLYNVKYNLPEWCQGGEAMLSAGEYVGNKEEVDGYCRDVRNANGGTEFMMGSFDFPLVFQLQNMVNAGGYFYIGNLPSAQQNMRYAEYKNDKVHRLFTFVNNHDTFRPHLTNDGKYTDNWEGSMGNVINPNKPRLGAAYATIMAMDGNPCVFMEDLFDLTNGKRYTHNPSNETELPVRSQIRNLIWCHQNLDFKYGDYNVLWEDDDLLVIERVGRAIIAINDNGNNDRTAWVKTSFYNVNMKDYSGSVDYDWYINDNWFEVKAPKADNGGSGYAVWAPAGKEDLYAPYRSKTTTQEWEMADDLGDSHCESLGQGGALPKNSTAQRLVGKIYVEKGKNVEYTMHPDETGRDITVAFYDLDGNRLTKKNGTSDVTGTWNATYSGWVAIKVWNTTSSNDGQKCWVRASYQAPATLTNTMNDRATTRASIWTGNGGSSSWTECKNWEQGKVPTSSSKVVIPENAPIVPVVNTDVTIKSLQIEKGKGNQSYPDLLVTSAGKLTVTNGSSSLQGTAYVCGAGSVSLGTCTGDFNLCPATLLNEMGNKMLFSVYPNPTHSTVLLHYSLSQDDAVVIHLKDAMGRTVSSINEGIQEVGSHEKELDLSHLPQGVYICTIKTSKGVLQAKIVKE